SNPDGFFDIRDEDFSVTDAPSLGGSADRLDCFFQPLLTQHNLDFHLGEKIYDVFGAAIELGVSFLAAEALGLGHRDALQADLLQGLFHLVEFERLDNGLDLLYRFATSRAARNRDR